MSKEYTKDQLLEAYKAGWNNALNGVGSLSTDAAFREWLEGLRPKVEEPPRPRVTWDIGRLGAMCFVDGHFMGSLMARPLDAEFKDCTDLELMYCRTKVPMSWASPFFHDKFDDCRERAEYYFIRAYNICVKERTGDGC